MKKRIAIVLSVIFIFTIFTGSVAYAANGNNTDNTSNGIKTRSEYINEIKPLVDEIVANRAEIKSLKTELVQVRQKTKSYIKGLKAEVGSITQEQIEKLQGILSEIKECRTTLIGTDTLMIRHRDSLRSTIRSRNYEAIKTAYQNIITVQQKRIEQIKKLIQLNKEILDI